jgi:hypothetical protein
MSAAVMDTPHIEAQVTLSYRECLRLSWIMLKESRSFWMVMFALMVIMRVQMLATSSPEDPAGPFWIDLVSWALFIATLTPLSALVMWHRSRVFAPMRYRFDADGLHVLNARAELRQSWRQIDQLKRKNDLLLLYVAKRPAHCIPLHTLHAPSDIDLLAAWARSGGTSRVDS